MLNWCSNYMAMGRASATRTLWNRIDRVTLLSVSFIMASINSPSSYQNSLKTLLILQTCFSFKTCKHCCFRVSVSPFLSARGQCLIRLVYRACRVTLGSWSAHRNALTSWLRSRWTLKHVHAGLASTSTMWSKNAASPKHAPAAPHMWNC